METETIDKLFLELSQVTTAKTERERLLEGRLEAALRSNDGLCGKFARVIVEAVEAGLLAVDKKTYHMAYRFAKVSVDAPPVRIDFILGEGVVHEDKLPELTDEEYAAWYEKSWVAGGVGCRVGPGICRPQVGL